MVNNESDVGMSAGTAGRSVGPHARVRFPGGRRMGTDEILGLCDALLTGGGGAEGGGGVEGGEEWGVWGTGLELDRAGASPGTRPDARDPIVEAFDRTAAFDADGTLWRRDFTYGVVDAAVARGLVQPEALAAYNALLARYGELEADAPEPALARLGEAYRSGRLLKAGAARGMTSYQVDLEVWPSCNWIFAGWTEAALETLAEEVWESGFKAEARPDMQVLLEAFRRRGVRTVVVSAGPEALIRIGAVRMGFRAEDVRGARSRQRGDCFIAETEPPVMFGPGKVEVCRALCGGRPLIAFGDSVASGDGGLLRDACFGVAVAPVGRHLDAARLAGLAILE